MKSNAEWKAWGKHDPLFAVSSWEGKGKGDASPWTDEEFYALGAKDWADFKIHWLAYGLSFGHCLEIGCGAGRITKQLTNDFKRVTALDVSEDQVAYARSRITSPNVTFDLTNGVELPLPESSIDAVFSCHVFQHFDSLEDAARVFSNIASAMKPGATLCIHLPLYKLPQYPVTPIVRQLHRLSKLVGSITANLNRARHKLIMRGLWYERDQLAEMLAKLDFIEIQTHGFSMSSNRSWHDLVLARKGVT
jgi:ubiquinone/menaquinone biosynthesis C-methylase UbiE